MGVISMKQLLEAGVQQRMMEEKIYSPLYTHTLSYAMECSRVDDYLDSRKLNFDYKRCNRKNFDGMHLAHDAEGGVLEEYGVECVVFILANTVQQLEYDGRFSFGIKAWAKDRAGACPERPEPYRDRGNGTLLCPGAD